MQYYVEAYFAGGVITAMILAFKWELDFMETEGDAAVKIIFCALLWPLVWFGAILFLLLINKKRK